jgi:hypothetical protein
VSRRDARSRSLRRRPSRATPSVAVALGLVALGIVLVWPAVSVLVTGAPPAWAGATGRWLAGQTWAGPWTITALVVAGVAGLVLATAEGELVDGVEGIRASVDGSSVRLRVTTSDDDPAAIGRQVEARLRRTYERAGLEPRPRIRVAVDLTGRPA